MGRKFRITRIKVEFLVIEAVWEQCNKFVFPKEILLWSN